MELTPSAGGQLPLPRTYAPGQDDDGRFAFGENWRRFLRVLNEDRIAQAETALREMLRVDDLTGKRFLDIGCGSGLSSLAARRLGAVVHSFDLDDVSVATTKELRRRYFPSSPLWTVEHGSALDRAYIQALGTFDVVYSWGVLHHTGRMWEAMENAILPVAPDGLFFIALYNDTGTQARRWRAIKKLYNRLPAPLRTPYVLAVTASSEIKSLARDTLAGRPWDYVRRWTAPRDRGMDKWRDMVDWVGGYPYEFARPEEVFDFCRDRGFTLRAMKCGGVGLGCNEFVFSRTAPAGATPAAGLRS